MKQLISLLLILGLSGCAFDGEPGTDTQAPLDSVSTLVPETFTPDIGEESPYTGSVTLFPYGHVAFPIPAEAKSVMPWYTGNADVREGDVYFNVGNNRNALLEFNLPRGPLWLPIPPDCVRAFMHNTSGETIRVGIIYSTEEK